MNLTEIPSELWGIVRQQPHVLAHLDAYSCIVRNLLASKDETEIKEIATSPVLDLILRRWQTLTLYANSKISGARTPLSGDLGLVAEIMGRKNDFEKWYRVMESNIEAVRMMLLQATSRASQSQLQAPPPSDVQKSKQ